MANFYILKLKHVEDNVMYYKIGVLNGAPETRMSYCNKDGSNEPLSKHFELVDFTHFEHANAYQIEQDVMHHIRNVWKWKTDGKKGIHRKHKFFPGKMISGLTEMRMFDSDEVSKIQSYVRSQYL